MKHHPGVGFHWEEPALFSQSVWGQPSTSDGEHIKSSWGGRLELFTTNVGVSSLIAQVLWVHSSPVVLKHRCHASIHKEQCVNTYKLVAEDPAGTHWPPVGSQRKSNCNWWRRRLIKRHFSPFWGQADPDSMQGKASATQHCESALTYCTFDAFLWLFFLLCQRWCQEKITKLLYSCRYAVLLCGQWASLLFWYKCLLLVQKTAVINVLLTGSRMWIIFLTGRASLILRPPADSMTKARTCIFHSNRRQTAVTVI